MIITESSHDTPNNIPGKLMLRPESPDDYEQIDNINARAFRSGEEPGLVRLLRESCSAFDPALSLVAENNGDLVGHVLVTPQTIQLCGEWISAVFLGPIAVLPSWQKQGVGGMLLKAAHEAAQGKGAQVSFLLGHPTYYPRHGYTVNFSDACIAVDVEQLPQPSIAFDVTPVTREDIPWLVQRNRKEMEEVDFGGLKGNTLRDWTSPCLDATIWRLDSKRAAYVLNHKQKNRLTLLLAEDPQLAREVIYTVRPQEISHHPRSWLARQALDNEPWVKQQFQIRNYCMACELVPGALARYAAELDAGTRLPGMASFPLPFCRF